MHDSHSPRRTATQPARAASQTAATQPLAPNLRFTIRARGVELSNALRDHVVRRMSFALSRVSPSLGAVDVTLEDINGPRGGIDKVCRVRARGPGLREIVIEERHSDVTVAIDLASSRTGHTLMRAIDVRRRTPRALVRA